MWNMGAPGGNKIKIWQNLQLVLVLHFDLPNPKWHLISVKCELPLEVCLLYQNIALYVK